MKRGIKMKFRKGAASFYIVAFSTLILTIVAMSFAAVIISEITRTANDDLAQSAYDSALAGIEDAKLAYYNYLTCKEDANLNDGSSDYNGATTCKQIIEWVENSSSCYTVPWILGKLDGDSGEEGEVFISETNTGGKSMQQAYTCVKLEARLNDYRGTLSDSNPTKVLQVKLSGTEDNLTIDDIKTIKVSWYSDTDGSKYQYTNFFNKGNNNFGVTFPAATLSKAATPPTISVGIVQTGVKFKLDDFDRAERERIIEDGKLVDTKWRTNRGMVYLVPMDNEDAAAGNRLPDNYIGAYKKDIGKNTVSARQVVKSNDQTVKNLPYGVYCDGGGGKEFACSAEIELPDPIVSTDGRTERNDETFMVVLSLPYGLPSTDFALEFCSKDGCEKQVVGDDGASVTTGKTAELGGMQVRVDSTGRASDMYRRIEARMDMGDTYYPYPMYAVELLGTDNNNLVKNFNVYCEAQSWDVWSSTCPGSNGEKGVWPEYNWVLARMTINYDSNGGGNVESQSVEVDMSIKLREAPKRVGYTFDGWYTGPNGTGIRYDGGQEYTPPDDMADDATMTLYAQWTEKKVYMQDSTFTINACKEMASDGDRVVYDKRDEQAYTVRYYNNQCWMTQNLNLAGGTTLKPSDSNVASDYKLPESGIYSLGFRNGNNVAVVYNSGNTDCTGRDSCYSYYNYYAATAGVGGNLTFGDANSDICPKGWRMPTQSEVLALYYVAPGNLAYSGYFINYGFYRNYAVYWSSTSGNKTRAYYLAIGRNGVRSRNGVLYKSAGLAVRCMKK